MLCVLKDGDPDWLECQTSSGTTGFVPRSYVEKCARPSEFPGSGAVTVGSKGSPSAPLAQRAVREKSLHMPVDGGGFKGGSSANGSGGQQEGARAPIGGAPGGLRILADDLYTDPETVESPDDGAVSGEGRHYVKGVGLSSSGNGRPPRPLSKAPELQVR